MNWKQELELPRPTWAWPQLHYLLGDIERVVSRDDHDQGVAFILAHEEVGGRVLPDQGGCGVGEPPGRQDREDDEADREGVAGDSRGSEATDERYQNNPARRADQDLQDPAHR